MSVLGRAQLEQFIVDNLWQHAEDGESPYDLAIRLLQSAYLDSENGWLNGEVKWHRNFDEEFDLVKEQGTKLTVATLTAALAGEVGEVANIVRKWADGVRPLDMDHLAEECADVLVFLCMMASYTGGRGFDFAGAYEHKKEVLRDRWTERRAQRDG